MTNMGSFTLIFLSFCIIVWFYVKAGRDKKATIIQSIKREEQKERDRQRQEKIALVAATNHAMEEDARSRELIPIHCPDIKKIHRDEIFLWKSSAGRVIISEDNSDSRYNTNEIVNGDLIFSNFRLIFSSGDPPLIIRLKDIVSSPMEDEVFKLYLNDSSAEYFVLQNNAAQIVFDRIYEEYNIIASPEP
jgi:hypothetical protein